MQDEKLKRELVEALNRALVIAFRMEGEQGHKVGMDLIRVIHALKLSDAAEKV